MTIDLDRQLRQAALAAAGASERASAAVAARDRLIYLAKETMTYVAIAALTDLSHQRIRQIVDAERRREAVLEP